MLLVTCGRTHTTDLMHVLRSLVCESKMLLFP